MPKQRREYKLYNEEIERTFTQHQTMIEQLDDSITLQATSIFTVSGRVDTLDGNVSTLDGNVSTLSGNVSSLSGDVNTLSGDVNTLSGDLSTLDTQVQTNEARMIIESNGILSTVTSAIGADTVISTVNQTAGSYVIDANKVDLRGVVSFSDLSTNGNTTIIGDNITTGVIKDSNSNTTFNLSTGALDITNGSILLGSTSGYYFQVTSAGRLAWNEQYSSMTSTGQLTCTNATISGTFTNESGLRKTVTDSGRSLYYYNDVLVGNSGSGLMQNNGVGMGMGLSYNGDYIGWFAQQTSQSSDSYYSILYYDRSDNGLHYNGTRWLDQFNVKYGNYIYHSTTITNNGSVVPVTFTDWNGNTVDLYVVNGFVCSRTYNQA